MVKSRKLDIVKRGEVRESTTLALPVVALTVKQIHERTEDWLNDAMTSFSAGRVYIALKQMEKAVEYAIGKAKKPAIACFESGLGEAFGAHAVQIKGGGTVYEFSPAVKALEDKLKPKIDELAAQANLLTAEITTKIAALRAEVDALKAKEIAEGVAKGKPSEKTIAVTLAKG